MNNQPINKLDDDELLDLAINEFRQQTIPPFPGPQNNSEHSLTPALETTSRRSVLAMGVPVLATIAVVLVIGVSVLSPIASKTAFSQVQEALLRIKTVQFKVLDHHDNWDGKPKTFETKVSFVEPHWSRSESEHSGIWIADWKQDKRINIKHDSRTVTYYETGTTEKSLLKRNEFLDQLRRIPAYSTERVGETEFNGTPAEQFYVDIGERKFLVTIDSATKLPLQMEFEKRGYRQLKTDFVFDEPIEMNNFAIETPEGYKEVIIRRPAAAPEFATGIVVSPKSGIGKCGFGSSIEKVIEYLGEPSKRDSRKFTGPLGGKHESSTLKYDSLGLSLFFNSDGLASLNCYSEARNGRSVRDYSGRTGKGLRMGDSRDKVFELYGVPDYESVETIRYVREGIDFYLNEASVSGIAVSQPLPPELEFEIDPETGAQTTRIRPRD